jgi:alpha-tubulin suppressor-like RCC1 family protein
VSNPGANECYLATSKQTFFRGRADQVEQVVSGGNNIFVLMKDGSVWGRGDNRRNFISKTSTKYYKDFVRIVPSGVKSIAATTLNVGMLKTDGTLWLWGEKTGKKKVTYTNKPYKVANKVKEFALGTDYNNVKAKTSRTMLILLKTNNTAYGWGSNDCYALTSKYKKGWINKPVKLRANIKHVYAGDGTSLLLDNKDRLYMAGTQWYRRMMTWVKP